MQPLIVLKLRSLDITASVLYLPWESPGRSALVLEQVMFFLAHKSVNMASEGIETHGECEAQADKLWQVADDFRAWVVRDLSAVSVEERLGYRGDYLFIIDGKPSFLVIVSPERVSSGRILTSNGALSVAFDIGASYELAPEVLDDLLNQGAVRVQVTTDSNTLRRLLGGTLKAKIAYLNGWVKISGDLPCFMRLVSLLKGRGVGPLQATANASSGSLAPLLKR